MLSFYSLFKQFDKKIFIPIKKYVDFGKFNVLDFLKGSPELLILTLILIIKLNVLYNVVAK